MAAASHGSSGAVSVTARVIARKWKPALVWLLGAGPRRFRDLQDELPGVAHKVLIQHLRELERDGLVRRQVVPGGPRHVEYGLTPLGESLRPVLDALNAWGEVHDAAADPARRP